jgi:hypothetical protein
VGAQNNDKEDECDVVRPYPRAEHKKKTKKKNRSKFWRRYFRTLSLIMKKITPYQIPTLKDRKFVFPLRMISGLSSLPAMRQASHFWIQRPVTAVGTLSIDHGDEGKDQLTDYPYHRNSFSLPIPLDRSRLIASPNHPCSRRFETPVATRS